MGAAAILFYRWLPQCLRTLSSMNVEAPNSVLATYFAQSNDTRLCKNCSIVKFESKPVLES